MSLLNKALSQKPFLEIKEPRFVSLICAVGGLVAALACLLFALAAHRILDRLLLIAAAVFAGQYSYVHGKRLFSTNRLNLRIDEAGISGKLACREGTIPWSDVAGCSTSIGGDITIRLKSGGHIRIDSLDLPPLFSGLDAYVQSYLTDDAAKSAGDRR